MKHIDTYNGCLLKKEESKLPYDLYLVTKRNNRKPFLYVCLEKANEIEYLTITINNFRPRLYKKFPLSEDGIDYKDTIIEYVKAYSDILIDHYNNNLSDKDTLNKIIEFDRVDERMN